MSDARIRILDTAEKLFNEVGFVNIGVDLIASESQISKVTLYRLFGSKQKLVWEVLNRYSTAQHEAILERINASASGMAQLRAVFRFYREWFSRSEFRGCLIVGALYDYKSDNDVRQIATRHMEAYHELFQTVLSQVVPPYAQHVLSRQLVFLLQGAITQAQAGRQSAAADDAWECAVQLIGRTT